MDTLSEFSKCVYHTPLHGLHSFQIYGRFQTDVLDRFLHHHHQNAKLSNRFWKNDVHPASGRKFMFRSTEAVLAACGGPLHLAFPLIHSPSVWIYPCRYLYIHYWCWEGVYMWTYCWVSPLPAGSVSSLQSPPVAASGSTHPSSHARCADGALHTHTRTNRQKISDITIVAGCCPSTN